MGSALVARLSIAAVAAVVVALLVGAERRRDDCVTATRAVFVRAADGGPALERALGPATRACDGSEALAQMAAGLLSIDRDRPATRLARAAVAHEADSYLAWAVLAVADPADGEAARRSRALNPLASSGAGP